MHAAQSGAQILEIVGQGEDRHHLRRRGDVPLRFADVRLLAQADHHAPQRAVVDVDDSRPADRRGSMFSVLPRKRWLSRNAAPRLCAAATACRSPVKWMLIVLHRQDLAVATTRLRHRGAWLHRGQRAVRDRDQPRPDDRLSRDAGVLRRRDHAERVPGRLHEIPRPQAGDDDGDDLDHPEPVVDLGTDDRRLFDRDLFVALAVSGQHRAGSAGRRQWSG